MEHWFVAGWWGLLLVSTARSSTLPEHTPPRETTEKDWFSNHTCLWSIICLFFVFPLKSSRIPPIVRLAISVSNRLKTPRIASDICHYTIKRHTYAVGLIYVIMYALCWEVTFEIQFELSHYMDIYVSIYNLTFITNRLFMDHYQITILL